MLARLKVPRRKQYRKLLYFTEMNVLVSIIVPMYNSRETIIRTISSLRVQTHQNVEIIVVDDGSNDNSSVLVQEIEDTRIRLIKKENNGASSARNRGLQEAQGDWITFVDADDVLLPHAIESLLNAADKETDVVIGCFQQNSLENSEYPEVIVDVDHELLAKQTLFWQKYAGLLNANVFTEGMQLLRINIGAPWAKLYKTNFLREKHILFSENLTLHEDTLFNYKAYKQAKNIKVVTQIVYCYIDNLNSITRSANPAFIQHVESAIESLLNTEPDLDESALYFCLYRISECLDFIFTESDSWISRYYEIKKLRGSKIIKSVVSQLPLKDNPYVDTYHIMELFLFKYGQNMLLACMPIVKNIRKIKNRLVSFLHHK